MNSARHAGQLVENSSATTYHASTTIVAESAISKNDALSRLAVKLRGVAASIESEISKQREVMAP